MCHSLCVEPYLFRFLLRMVHIPWSSASLPCCVHKRRLARSEACGMGARNLLASAMAEQHADLTEGDWEADASRWSTYQLPQQGPVSMPFIAGPNTPVHNHKQLPATRDVTSSRTCDCAALMNYNMWCDLTAHVLHSSGFPNHVRQKRSFSYFVHQMHQDIVPVSSNAYMFRCCRSRAQWTNRRACWTNP